MPVHLRGQRLSSLWRSTIGCSRDDLVLVRIRERPPALDFRNARQCFRHGPARRMEPVLHWCPLLSKALPKTSASLSMVCLHFLQVLRPDRASSARWTVVGTAAPDEAPLSSAMVQLVFASRSLLALFLAMPSRARRVEEVLYENATSTKHLMRRAPYIAAGCVSGAAAAFLTPDSLIARELPSEYRARSPEEYRYRFNSDALGLHPEVNLQPCAHAAT